jgi:hypothetical protein
LVFQDTADTIISIFYDIQFLNADTGFVVGGQIDLQTFTESARFLKTTDGGATWSSQIIGPPDTYLYSLHFLNANTGYVAGASNGFGIIMMTTDGGANWTTQTSGVFDELNSLQFVGGFTGGVAVGISGTILRTTDGGANWLLQFSGTGEDLYSVHFPTPNGGHAVGDSGTILFGYPPLKISAGELSRARLGFANNGYFRYELSRSGRVQARLFDLRGRMALNLLDAAQEAGAHRLRLSSGNLAPGAYFLDFRAEGLRTALPLAPTSAQPALAKRGASPKRALLERLRAKVRSRR